MNITEDRIADIVILTLSGKLDATHAKTFEDKILADIGSGNRRFVIDMSQLEYVSSSGLRVFLVAAKRLQAENGRIVLCSLQEQIRQVFDIAGFSSIFSIYSSREEVIKSLQ